MTSLRLCSLAITLCKVPLRKEVCLLRKHQFKILLGFFKDKAPDCFSKAVCALFNLFQPTTKLLFDRFSNSRLHLENTF